MENYYKLKSWCDAKDQKGEWRLGRIKQKKKNIITVHFDGWSDRYKLFYCIHSKNLAPARHFSRGYTGQPSIALREWEFNENALRADEAKMSKMTSNKFKGLGPYEITTFIRGDLFIHIDCLLTFTYTNPATDIKNVESFLMRALHFCIQWIDFTLTCTFPAKNYLNSTNDALIFCGFEVFEMIRSILGFNKRTNKHFSTYKVFTSNIEYCKNFMAESAKFFKLIENYPVEDYWNLLYVMPLISECSGKKIEPEKSSKFVTCLNSAIEIFPDILKKSENVEFSDKVFNTLGSFVGTDKADELKRTLTRKSSRDYKIEITDSSNGSVIEHEEQINSLEEVISPIKITKMKEFQDKKEETKKNFEKIEKNEKIEKTEKNFKENKKKTQIFDFEENYPINLPMPPILETGFSNIKADYSELQELINEKFDKCMKMIKEKINYEEQNFNHLMPLKDYLVETADRSEEKVLERLEYLIKKRNVIEALNVARWRKKICRIALLDGWEIADKISKMTVDSLKVTTDHVIQANLSNFLMKFD